MVSRENAAILAAFVLFVVAVAAATAAGYGSSRLVGVVVVPGIVILLPQLYLALTDRESDVPARYRIRFGVLVTVLYAGGSATTASGTERTTLQVIAGGLLVALLAYEVVAGYREAAGETA